MNIADIMSWLHVSPSHICLLITLNSDDLHTKTLNDWLTVKNHQLWWKMRFKCRHDALDFHSPPRCCAGLSHTCALSQWSPWQHGPHRSALGWVPWCLWQQVRWGYKVFQCLASCWQRRCCYSIGCWSPWAPVGPASIPWNQWEWDSDFLPAL